MGESLIVDTVPVWCDNSGFMVPKMGTYRPAPCKFQKSMVGAGGVGGESEKGERTKGYVARNTSVLSEQFVFSLA